HQLPDRVRRTVDVDAHLSISHGRRAWHEADNDVGSTAPRRIRPLCPPHLGDAPSGRRADHPSMENARIAVAELIGTFVLVIAGPGSAVLATGGFFETGSIGVLG